MDTPVDETGASSVAAVSAPRCAILGDTKAISSERFQLAVDDSAVTKEKLESTSVVNTAFVKRIVKDPLPGQTV